MQAEKSRETIQKAHVQLKYKIDAIQKDTEQLFYLVIQNLSMFYSYLNGNIDSISLNAQQKPLKIQSMNCIDQSDLNPKKKISP